MHVPVAVLFIVQLLTLSPIYILLSCISYVSLFDLEGEYILFALFSLLFCIFFNLDKIPLILLLLYYNIRTSAPLLGSCLLLDSKYILRLILADKDEYV